MRVQLSVTFIAVCIFQRVISGRPPFDWGPPSPNRGDGNNKNENENNENTNGNNNKDMHINTYQTNENPKCTQLKSFTPNLCSIDSARRLCPIHCRKPEYIRNCALSCGVKLQAPSKEKATKRVYGGKESQPGEWPWMASVQTKHGTKSPKICGGAILSKNFILTAAHCFKKFEHKDPSKWLVKSSDHRQTRYDRGETSHNVKKIIVHGDYTTFNRPRPQSYSDVAILQLSDAIDLMKESKGRLCLPSIDHPARPGMDCYVAGWGKTSKDTRYTSETLQHAKMKLIDRDTCNLPGMISGGGLKEREICAGYRDLRADICPGDSGGSLVCQLNGKWYSTGIVSHSYGCGPNYIKATNKRNIFPFAVFADVNVFKEWIVNSIVYDSEPL